MKKRFGSRIKKRRTSVKNFQTLSIAHLNLIRSSVGVGIKWKVIEIWGNVISGTSVRVPVLIIVRYRRMDCICLRIRWRRRLVLVVESILTSCCCMAYFGTDLTLRFVGVWLLLREEILESIPPTYKLIAIVRTTFMWMWTMMSPIGWEVTMLTEGRLNSLEVFCWLRWFLWVRRHPYK